METPVVPTASPATLPELATYLEPFAPLFRRSTSRESLERYVTGSIPAWVMLIVPSLLALDDGSHNDLLFHPSPLCRDG